MTEIRKHYFLDEYCIIAVDRGKRPSDFKKPKTDVGDSSNCPFCPGNEDKTPLAEAVYKGGKVLKDENGNLVRDWDARCFPNLYPALGPNGSKTKSDETKWLKQAGYGFHEIVAETKSHTNHPSDLNDDEIKLLVKVYSDRTKYYLSQEGIEYVSLFRNHGREAGASLLHPHTQIISSWLLPPKISNELKKIKIKSCPYCDIVKKEAESERLIEENEDWICFAPFYSKSPFEMWILPKSHKSNIFRYSKEELDSFAIILRNSLRRLKDVVDDPPYNFMFFQTGGRKYHFNVRVRPKISIEAGFEKNTDIYINIVPPEDAAKYLK